MNRVARGLWNFGSGRIWRFTARRLRDMGDRLPLGPAGAVLRAPLLAFGHAAGVEDAADDVVAHPRHVLQAPAADQGAPRARFTAFLSDPQLTLEVASTLNVRVEMEEGYHIYAEPLPDDYYPTTVRLEPVRSAEPPISSGRAGP